MDGQIYNLNEKRKKKGLLPIKNPYYVNYRVLDIETGSYKQTTKRGFRTKDEAQRFLNDVQQKIVTNNYVKPKSITLKEYLTEWMEDYVKVNCKQSTIDGYAVNVEKHIIPKLGGIHLQKLTANQIEKFYRQKMLDGRLDGKGGLSAKSILYIHRNLSEALEKAARKRLITYNVAKDVTLPKVIKFRPEVYSHETILDILDAIKGSIVEIAFALAALAGLRRGEALGLRWDDVDFATKTITIGRQLVNTTKGIEFITPKTEESIRKIPISNELRVVLERVESMQLEYMKLLGEEYQDNGLVCCREDGSLINPSSMDKMYSRELQKRGFKPIRYHNLRHSYATYMIRMGIPLNVVSKLLGHKTVGTTMEIYVHVLNEMQQEAIEKQDQVFEEYRRKKIESTSTDTNIGDENDRLPMTIPENSLNDLNAVTVN